MARSLDFRRPVRQPPSPRRKQAMRSSPGALAIGLVVLGAIALGTHFGKAQPPRVQNSSLTTPPASSSPLIPTPTTSPAPPPTSPSLSALPSPSDLPSPSTTLPMASSSPPPTPSASPSPSTSLTQQTVSLRLLNGTGTAGQANLARQRLTAKGWAVNSIAVAATRRATTIIYYREGAGELAHQLATDLGVSQTTSLQANSSIVGSNDILVILGSDWG